MRNFVGIPLFCFLLTSYAAPIAIGATSASVISWSYVDSGLFRTEGDVAPVTLPANWRNPEVVTGPLAIDLYDPVSISRRDTLFVKDTSYHHSWKRATILSACIPGAGQIYNEFGYHKVQNKRHRAWWKVPIIYGALGVTSYYFYQNLALARSLKAEWIYRDTYGDSLILYPEFELWNKTELLEGRINSFGYTDPGFDIAAKRRDMLGFGFIALWGLQVVEALVDGHFVTFDISEDLSFNWSPVMLDRYTPGVALRLEIN